MVATLSFSVCFVELSTTSVLGEVCIFDAQVSSDQTAWLARDSNFCQLSHAGLVTHNPPVHIFAVASDRDDCSFIIVLYKKRKFHMSL